MDIFETYEKEYKSLFESITKKVAALPSSIAEPRKLLQNQLKREMEEADEILGQMEMELASLSGMARAKLGARVTEYRKNLKNIAIELSRSNERDQLLGPSSFDLESQVQDQRSKMLMGTDQLAQTSNRLDQAHRIALETEQLGINTLSDLSRQRQQLENTRDGLSQADTWISKSQGLLKVMKRRMQQNQIITWGIAILLVVLILLIIVMKLT